MNRSSFCFQRNLIINIELALKQELDNILRDIAARFRFYQNNTYPFRSFLLSKVQTLFTYALSVTVTHSTRLYMIYESRYLKREPRGE